MVKGGEYKESYASEFVDSMLNDDVDESGTRIEPESHKEHSENVNNDDEVIEKEKKNDEIEEEKKDDDIEKMNEIKKEKKDDDVEKTMRLLKRKIMMRLQRVNTTLNLCLTTSSSIADKSTANLQQQLYLNMKTKPQDQAADPEL
ncbi:hypothetical protein Tco_0200663 [Tanacetum coccineum]